MTQLHFSSCDSNEQRVQCETSSHKPQEERPALNESHTAPAFLHDHSALHSIHELRRQRVPWLWAGCALYLLVGAILDGLWTSSASFTSTQSLLQSVRWILFGLLILGCVLSYSFRLSDLTLWIAEWIGWLCIALYLGSVSAWMYGGESALLTTVLALLLISRSILIPDGVRNYAPPMALLWGLYVLTVWSFSGASSHQWILGSFLFSQFLLAIAYALGCFATWNWSRLRSLLIQSNRLGRYQIQRRLQTHGMSQLYIAWHTLLHQECVLKRIPCRAQNWDAAVEEFRKEAQLVMNIQSPHVVRVFDFGETQNDVYVAMEYLEGIHLGALLRLQGPLCQRRALHLMRQVCLGMQEVHRKGILHQDIKPANLYLTVEHEIYDYVKVLDFGIARRLQASPQQLAARGRGKISGTPAYMAPERFEGQGDETSDIYAIGAVLYCLVFGRPPFRAQTVHAYKELHTHTEPTIPEMSTKDEAIHPQLRHMLERCLAKQPEKRYASVHELQLALEACQHKLGAWTQHEAFESWKHIVESKQSYLESSKSKEHSPPEAQVEPFRNSSHMHTEKTREKPKLVLPHLDDLQFEPRILETHPIESTTTQKHS